MANLYAWLYSKYLTCINSRNSHDKPMRNWNDYFHPCFADEETGSA